jgi:hypothetical protein
MATSKILYLYGYRNAPSSPCLCLMKWLAQKQLFLIQSCGEGHGCSLLVMVENVGSPLASDTDTAVMRGDKPYSAALELTCLTLFRESLGFCHLCGSELLRNSISTLCCLRDLSPLP